MTKSVYTLFMPREHILVIDDDDRLTLLLEELLTQEGYDVTAAHDGRSALDFIDQKTFDLIILDVILPGADGLALCGRLREHPHARLAPILMLSGRSRPVDKVTGLKLGADDYMTKPFENEELVAKVQSLLRRTDLMMGANPLTRLPGNHRIMQEVHARLERRETFAFAYLDIDHFKAFNDHYGYEKGDQVLTHTARIIEEHLGPAGFLGHVGGDDFVLIDSAADMDSRCREIIRHFEAGVAGFYDEAARARGGIESRDRQGRLRRFAFMSLSIGILSNEARTLEHYGQIVQVASEMKQYAKRHKAGGRSSIAWDKRLA